jgi:urease alpha subunit
MSSDAQGMGRAGETVARTFATAGTMKERLADDDLGSADGALDSADTLRTCSPWPASRT